MNKKIIGAFLIAAIAIIIGIAMFAVGESEPVQEEPAQTETEAPQNTETADGEYVLSELPEGSFEVQDNTVTDTWGVVLLIDQLPEDLQQAEAYTVTIGETTYDLTLNKYNDNVYSGQVSSVEHTQEEVEQGIIRKK